VVPLAWVGVWPLEVVLVLEVVPELGQVLPMME
jgi:hypothetical protein